MNRMRARLLGSALPMDREIYLPEQVVVADEKMIPNNLMMLLALGVVGGFLFSYVKK